MSLLDGRVAIATGGSPDIGREIALAYVKVGTDAVARDTREEAREGGVSTHEQIESDIGSSATCVGLDMTDPAVLEAVMDAAEVFGGGDVVVSNAGTWRPEELLEVTEAGFQ